MAKKSKRYTEAAALVEKGKAYTVEEAIELVKKTSSVKFDASVDVAFNLGLDVRQADQQLRGAVVLPHGTGKTKKVLVVAEGPKAQEAKDAGADIQCRVQEDVSLHNQRHPRPEGHQQSSRHIAEPDMRRYGNGL